MGRRGSPPEFRRRVLDLVTAGRKVADVARDLGLSQQTIYVWRHQDRIDRGLEPGLVSAEREELRAAKRRIRELETELKAHRRAADLLGETTDPKRRVAAVAVKAQEHLPVGVCCRVPRRLRVRLLRAAEPSPAAAFDPPCLADRPDHPDPREVPGHLRRSARPRRTHSRRGHRRWAPGGRDAHAPGRCPGRLRPAEVEVRAAHRNRIRPRRATVRAHRAGPTLGDRHHRAPDARGKVLLLRCPRRLQPPRRWLVDRLRPDSRTSDQGPRHGHRGP